MYRLSEIDEPFDFPDNFKTTPEGLLAVGGNLHPLTLICAYAKGIFPWFNEGQPILWWHPSPRLVMFPKNLHISRRMKDTLKHTSFLNPIRHTEASYRVTLNKDFAHVIKSCAKTGKKGREDTWITPGIKKSYVELHKMGFAHSVEVWNKKNELVGGMYGIAMGKIFFGESMFSVESDMSKIALIWLCAFLEKNKFLLLDCQVESAHLKTLGATTISQKEFLNYLKKGGTHLKKPAEEFLKLS